jgi:hypothetical protein
MKKMDKMSRANQRRDRVGCPRQSKHSPRIGEYLEIPYDDPIDQMINDFDIGTRYV